MTANDSRTPEQTIPVSGVWLRREGDDVEVMVEVAGNWYRAISENATDTLGMSHIAEARGITTWPKVEIPND